MGLNDEFYALVFLVESLNFLWNVETSFAKKYFNILYMNWTYFTIFVLNKIKLFNTAPHRISFKLLEYIFAVCISVSIDGKSVYEIGNS